MENITQISVSFLRLIPPSTKAMFFYLIVIISTISIIGNIFALKSVVHRNIKCLQKISLVSLALTDIFSVVIFSINNLHSLSKELKTWDLGEFMCYFIPMGQALGTTMSSFSLLLIALDRYQSLNSIVVRKWNPGLYKSQLVLLMLWLVSAAISLPMIKMYYFYPILIIYDDPELEDEESAMCLTTTKYKLQSYYTTIACVIFFPLVVIFSWLYYKIAVILWKHRIPQTSPLADVPCKENTSNTSESSPAGQKVKATLTVRDVKLERKIRTFKVIIVLLLTFVLCRLPYWVFFVVRLSKDIPGDTAWNIHYSFICLNLLNCALNPFLYTFLNQSISALDAVKQLLGKVFSFCCCFSNSDFDEFTKYNPFVLEEGSRKKKGSGNGVAEENPCNLACAAACVKSKKSNIT